MEETNYNQFTGINLQSEVAKQYEFKSPNKVFEDLSLINIFVGSNNSGKSRWMRELAKAIFIIYATKTIRKQCSIIEIKIPISATNNP